MNGMTEQLDTTAAQSTLPPVLTIAGSDSSGGAGIQADLKTMLANGVFGMSAITAITAQNTMGVTDVQNITPDMVAAQIDAVYTDIPPAAVKIGMVSSAELICTIADRLEAHHARHIVLDPMMVATSGAKLIDDDAITALTERLFPLAEVITPNIPETEVLLDLIAHRGASLDPAKWAEDTDRESTRIVSDTAMEDAGRTVSEHYGCAVLVKGGHGVADASDLLYADGVATWIHGVRVDNPNTHGTGADLHAAGGSLMATPAGTYRIYRPSNTATTNQSGGIHMTIDRNAVTQEVPIDPETGKPYLNTVAAIQVSANGVGSEVSPYVAQAVEVIRESGLPQETNALFTNVEGDLDEVLKVAGEAAKKLAEQGYRTSLVLHMDIRPGFTGQLTEKPKIVDAILSGKSE